MVVRAVAGGLRPVLVVGAVGSECMHVGDLADTDLDSTSISHGRLRFGRCPHDLVEDAHLKPFIIGQRGRELWAGVGPFGGAAAVRSTRAFCFSPLLPRSLAVSRRQAVLVDRGTSCNELCSSSGEMSARSSSRRTRDFVLIGAARTARVSPTKPSGQPTRRRACRRVHRHERQDHVGSRMPARRRQYGELLSRAAGALAWSSMLARTFSARLSAGGMRHPAARSFSRSTRVRSAGGAGIGVPR
jgi:hypothetical protein